MSLNINLTLVRLIKEEICNNPLTIRLIRNDWLKNKIAYVFDKDGALLEIYDVKELTSLMLRKVVGGKFVVFKQGCIYHCASLDGVKYLEVYKCVNTKLNRIVDEYKPTSELVIARLPVYAKQNKRWESNETVRARYKTDLEKWLNYYSDDINWQMAKRDIFIVLNKIYDYEESLKPIEEIEDV